MPKISLVGPSAEWRAPEANARRAINWFPHLDQTGKENLIWVGTPGTSLNKATAAGVRGMHVWGSTLYFVAGSGLYSYDGSTVSSSLGTLASASGNVSMAHSRKELVICTGEQKYYVWDGASFTTVDDFSTYVTLDSTDSIIVNTNVATVHTTSDHGAASGDSVLISGMTDDDFNGTFTVSTSPPDSTHFTFAITKTDGTYTSDAATASIRTDSLPIQPQRVTYMDGYFVMNNSRTNVADGVHTGEVYYTVPDEATTVTASRFLVAQRDPDAMLTPYADKGNLLLFGELSTEVWYNPGTSTIDPFEPARSAVIPWGITGPWTVARLGNGVVWLGGKDNSSPCVLLLEGYDAKKISTPAVEYQLKANSSYLSAATAYSYIDEGHEFYVLTFNTQTWVYDAATEMWHERQSWSGSTWAQHRGKWYAYLGGKHLLSDHTASLLLEMSLGTYTDYVTNATHSIRRLGRSAHITMNDKMVAHRSVFVDMAHPTASSFMTLKWSDDGGHSWTQGETKSTRGYDTRVEWWRLGAAEDRVYEISTESQQLSTVIAAWADVASEKDEK